MTEKRERLTFNLKIKKINLQMTCCITCKQTTMKRTLNDSLGHKYIENRES